MRNKTITSPAEGRRLLSYREAAEVLGVSEKTVWNLVNRDRQLPCVRILNCVKIDRADIDRFIDRQKAG